MQLPWCGCMKTSQNESSAIYPRVPALSGISAKISAANSCTTPEACNINEGRAIAAQRTIQGRYSCEAQSRHDPRKVFQQEPTQRTFEK